MAKSKKGKTTETIFKLALIAFLLMMLWICRDYPERSRLFPRIIFSLTILLILGSFLQDFMKPKQEQEQEKPKAPEPPPSDAREEQLRRIKELEDQGESDAGYEVLEDGLRRKRLREGIIIILVSLGIGYIGGFLLTVPLYFIAFGLLHGKKEQVLKYLAVAAGVTLVTYFFFDWFMGVPLLRGLWWG